MIAQIVGGAQWDNAKTALAMPAAIQQAKSTANRRFFIGVFLLCTNSCAGGLSIAGIVLEYTGPPAQKASIAGIR